MWNIISQFGLDDASITSGKVVVMNEEISVGLILVAGLFWVMMIHLHTICQYTCGLYRSEDKLVTLLESQKF